MNIYSTPKSKQESKLQPQPNFTHPPQWPPTQSQLGFGPHRTEKIGTRNPKPTKSDPLQTLQSSYNSPSLQIEREKL